MASALTSNTTTRATLRTEAHDLDVARRGDLREAREVGKAVARETILAAAAAILLEEGAAALTLRRLASAVNASTKVIYTGFGGKDGLLNALYLHSFAGLETALRAHRVITPPPERIRAMCHSYRDFARAAPALYHVMYGEFGRDFVVPTESRRRASAAFNLLREAVAAALPKTKSSEAGMATRLVWAAMHGVVSLEAHDLLGTPDQCERLFTSAIAAAARTYDIRL